MMSKRAQKEVDDGFYHPRPVVTCALLLVIWGLFFAMAALSHWHVSTFSDHVCDLFGYKQNDRIVTDGRLAQWWRFVTPIFLHGGLLHICVNSFSFYIIGKQLEPFYGSRRFFLVFMIAGIAGVLASFRFSHNPSLGASGALFGLVGAGIVFPIRFRSLIAPAQGRRIVIQLARVAAINLIIGFSLGGYVDNSAHVGGLFGGGFAALFLLPDALDARTNRRASDALLWLSCAGMVTVIGYSAIAQARWAMGPWWRLSVPRTLQPITKIGQFQGEWRSHDGVSLSISDTVHNPNLLPVSVYFLQRRDLPENVISVGQWHGRAFAFQNNNETVEIYLIVVYGRVLVITLNVPTSKFSAMKPQLDGMIKSITFLHPPPPDLHPIPVAAKAKPLSAKDGA